MYHNHLPKVKANKKNKNPNQMTLRWECKMKINPIELNNYNSQYGGNKGQNSNNSQISKILIKNKIF